MCARVCARVRACACVCARARACVLGVGVLNRTFFTFVNISGFYGSFRGAHSNVRIQLALFLI